MGRARQTKTGAATENTAVVYDETCHHCKTIPPSLLLTARLADKLTYPDVAVIIIIVARLLRRRCR